MRLLILDWFDGPLDAVGRTAAGESYWVHGSAPVEEKTRSFPIDKGGKQIIRLVVTGPESGSFKVELGGSAFAVTQ